MTAYSTCDILNKLDMLYLNQKCGHEANRAKVCSPCEIKNLGQRFAKAENFSLI